MVTVIRTNPSNKKYSKSFASLGDAHLWLKYAGGNGFYIKKLNDNHFVSEYLGIDGKMHVHSTYCIR